MHRFDEALVALVGDEFPRIRPPLNHPLFGIGMYQFYCKKMIRFSGLRVSGFGFQGEGRGGQRLRVRAAAVL